MHLCKAYALIFHFVPAKDYVHLWKTKILNNKKCTHLTCLTSWVKIHRCFQITLQAVHSGCIFTHTSGSWTWEPRCWQMADRARNNGQKLDRLKPLNFVQNLDNAQTYKHSLCVSACVCVCVCLSLWWGLAVKRPLCVLHYPHKIKFIHSFIFLFC